MQELLDLIRQLDEDEVIAEMYHARGRKVNVAYVNTKVLGDYLAGKVSKAMQLIDEFLAPGGGANIHNWNEMRKAGYQIQRVPDEFVAVLDTRMTSFLFECD